MKRFGRRKYSVWSMGAQEIRGIKKKRRGKVKNGEGYTVGKDRNIKGYKENKNRREKEDEKNRKQKSR